MQPCLAFAALLLVAVPAFAAAPKAFSPDARTGTSTAVLIGDVPQIHTTQLLPLDAKGHLVGKGDAAAQVAGLLDRLDAVLREAGSSLGQAVKVNVYVARAEVVAEVEKSLAQRFKGANGPAATFVVTPLPHPESLVAIDAVAVGAAKGEKRGKGGRWAALPPGARLYISGQAEKGKDLAEATRKTLASLKATLEHLGLTLDDVVQAKSFLTPMSGSEAARKELAAFFGERLPPLAFVEWASDLPIEIEMVVAAGKARPGEVIEYLTPPKMTASPVYSRVARINRGPTIYVGGLYGGKMDTPAAEVDNVFAVLKRLVEEAGGDLRHLAKATYYVSADPVSRKLNELRPKYYDPRPPAASKARVAGTGRVGTLGLDMIAVPKASK